MPKSLLALLALVLTSVVFPVAAQSPTQFEQNRQAWLSYFAAHPEALALAKRCIAAGFSVAQCRQRLDQDAAAREAAGWAQFNLEMMQPLPLGQSPLGAFGQALEAGQAAADGRIEEYNAARRAQALEAEAEAQRDYNNMRLNDLETQVNRLKQGQ